ncbi:hypothetical protein K7X08_033127 [Anisodus acutangulus]|uniref:Uncharacterized protein n=1 Tax=Anisodus acutangulus TaxID=402998 RepID=A0A9Q1R9T9_9SOLA|nr:hypothetical protein K7X08_033127 [Anisodus acutangulus]
MSTFTFSSDTKEVEEKNKESEVTSRSLAEESANNVGFGDTDAPVVQTSVMGSASEELVPETQTEKDEETTTRLVGGNLPGGDDGGLTF